MKSPRNNPAPQGTHAGLPGSNYTAQDGGRGRHRIFTERLMIIVIFVVALWLMWSVRTLVVDIIGAVAGAVLLRAMADPISARTGLSPRLAVTLSVVILLILAGSALWLFGSTLSAQFTHLDKAIPQAWRSLREQIALLPFGQELLSSLTDALDFTGIVPRLVSVFGSAATTLVLIPVGAVFLAAQPALYTHGLVTLFPCRQRPMVTDALHDSGRALRLWLLGQLISMVAVGLLTGVGLWLAGVPSAVALGLISGLAEGVPYLGPIIGAVPGLLLALIHGPETALWAMGIYVGVQQIEGNTLVPIIHRELVSLPPALTLFWIVAAGAVFGIIGMVFATPILVVLFVLVKRLYVRGMLDTDTSIPGETPEQAGTGQNASSGSP
ncbi:AI-2E family transporter [Novosphingobium profundi]|uniref:AI-2E family transporter n=1 Tax=Novosphingobium profundi TaxID=1774954 RepID=UPI001BDAA1A9|nr:AI-2E family transporter [Novosphingobium profundi]MBT0667628.1 AI-2E family transporter [Novosphingobium profundi]